MDRCSMSISLVMAWVIMVSISVVNLAEGQALPPCAEQISQCLDYINTTITPSNTCCNPLKNIYATQKTCLCQFVFTPGILESLGVTETQAFKLGHSCGVEISNTICKAALSAPTPSSSVKPQATRGADEGGAGRVKITVLSFALLFWTAILFNWDGCIL
ncbi:PREDICTED: lipid transfer-like protein VAS [Lupinus angustifolius]|uniref:lipid transfer-like protein VAS n=1 Tax=Lupinus angustifolius TaxID=3871 RepID=UPI00092F60FF|nr:PREDICTED: lipid transfer-like protein VAS [Lupinus angustifolius]